MYKVSLKKKLPRRYASHNQFLQLRDTVFPSESVLRIRTGTFYGVSVINLDANYDSKLYSTTEHCWALSKFCHLQHCTRRLDLSDNQPRLGPLQKSVQIQQRKALLKYTCRLPLRSGNFQQKLYIDILRCCNWKSDLVLKSLPVHRLYQVKMKCVR